MMNFIICLQYSSYFSFVFFFQAEDGIRDADVTGVQTCALPISGGLRALRAGAVPAQRPARGGAAAGADRQRGAVPRAEPRRAGRGDGAAGAGPPQDRKSVV